mmetsp:Transcript_5797/g.12807  ORF Transcript_5797/g.12807 Transcript_5797/m.12807 type:complete len:107 (+) Transcript_5797:43-363(+)|eukprot:CAMPEP_0202901362 /NCGR_PEP_ID=MMETSP1392-20130828/14211_1 /ASSEMBLY_ACC=CAM_ASM_000868 /TAXON_ID=225041 /ORGANISM="Chlamydomonas chlamydogama, Strain SAG 11-48b" /LENGTH=106 /DNA_ID=CAMNT_0049587911 /DNA_START=42 /DNA_END=362 /DNA_ORIENTATION=+
MVQLEENKFLTELNKLFERHKTVGSVWITMKRSNNKPRGKKTDPSSADYKCLVRAVAGKKDKKREIATLVSASQYLKFQQSMTVIMKAHMDALKKKEKVKHAKKDS